VTSFAIEALPQRIVFGVGAVAGVPDEVDRLGLHRVLLIAGGSAKLAGDDVADRLGPRVAARWSEVRQHVPEALAARARAAAAEAGADGVLTVGGGSATGLGKAVTVHTGLPLVAVPTTYAGSEASHRCRLTRPARGYEPDPAQSERASRRRGAEERSERAMSACAKSGLAQGSGHTRSGFHGMRSCHGDQVRARSGVIMRPIALATHNPSRTSLSRTSLITSSPSVRPRSSTS
jgi:Iron-containing alcohol dehydrogenase